MKNISLLPRKKKNNNKAISAKRRKTKRRYRPSTRKANRYLLSKRKLVYCVRLKGEAKVNIIKAEKGGNIRRRKRKFISSKLWQKQGDDIKQLERQKWKSQYHRKKEKLQSRRHG